MEWRKLIKDELEAVYPTTEKLMDMVDSDKLDWKPSNENNWMTVAQLLKHLSESCGAAFKGFVTGDWGFPEGFDPSTISPEEMMPPAEKMGKVESVEEAKKLLATDKQLAFDILAECSDDRLENEISKAFWDEAEPVLGYRLLEMVDHIKQHKGQLFYYLKLIGKPVNTGDLW
ncbi:MAG: DinB family protein [Melioribacteraceae bacterium]|nr:DinB family protein [Melioribacteraceae bacterium]